MAEKERKIRIVIGIMLVLIMCATSRQMIFMTCAATTDQTAEVTGTSEPAGGDLQNPTDQTGTSDITEEQQDVQEADPSDPSETTDAIENQEIASDIIETDPPADTVDPAKEPADADLISSDTAGDSSDPPVQTLTIQQRTGLPGSEDYETAATFTYEELLEKSYWEDDYTYIDPVIGVIIDHAKGVSLRELLTDADIDLDTVAELSFLSDESQLTLSVEELLNTDRHCYFSLPDHYHDGSYLTDPMAALFCQEVETILAVQDHWMPVSEGGAFWSNPAEMTGENAFRLAFGQADITESRAEASLCHIHTIRILTDVEMQTPDSSADGEQQETIDREEIGQSDPDTGDSVVMNPEVPDQSSISDKNKKAKDPSITSNSRIVDRESESPGFEPSVLESSIENTPTIRESQISDHSSALSMQNNQDLEIKGGGSTDIASLDSRNSGMIPKGQTSEDQQQDAGPSNTLISKREDWQTSNTPTIEQNPERSDTITAPAGRTGATLSGSRAYSPQVTEILLNEDGIHLDNPPVRTNSGFQNPGNGNYNIGKVSSAAGNPAKPVVDDTNSAVSKPTEPVADDTGSAVVPSFSEQLNPQQNHPIDINGNNLRVYEMTPVVPEPDNRGTAFATEYTIDFHQFRWFLLAVFLLPITGGLIGYIREYCLEESEQRDDTEE